MNPSIIDTDTGDELWSARRCADHSGVKPATWTSYLSRGQCPAPVGALDGHAVWRADEVREWAAARNPRQRARYR